MHLKHGPDNTAGDTIASTNHPECPPDGAAGEPLVNNDNPEDGPEGHPTATTGPQDDHQTPTLAVHIQKHEDIETAAQDRADATVEKIRRETERTYHLEFDRAIREIRSDQNRNFNQKLDEAIGQFRETLEGLAREYSGKLQDLETGNRENREQHDPLMEQLRAEADRNRGEAAQHREELDKAHSRRNTAAAEEARREQEEQLEQYRKICSDTTQDLAKKLDEAIRTNTRNIDSRLREHRTATVREQQQKTLEVISATEARWKKRMAVVLTITLTASAIAATALLTAVL